MFDSRDKKTGSQVFFDEEFNKLLSGTSNQLTEANQAHTAALEELNKLKEHQQEFLEDNDPVYSKKHETLNKLIYNLAEKIKDLLSIKDNLIKLHEIGLLNASNAEYVIKGITIDKSSQVRLTGLGLDDLNKTGVQKRWGWFCVGMESDISLALQKPDVTLKELFDYASNKRKMIAKLEHATAANEFGKLRSRKGRDWYNEWKGVANQAIFPSLTELMNQSKNSLQFTNANNCTFENRQFSEDISNYMQCNISNISLIDKCVLPEMKIEIGLNDKNKIISIATEIGLVKNLNECLNALGEHFLPIFVNKSISQEHLLTHLGIFIFHMARLYPLTRGSGAVTECMARGILKYHYPDIELGSLMLGEKRDVPYDICAHLIQDPKIYSDMFAYSIAKQINIELSKEVSIEHDNDPSEGDEVYRMRPV